MRNELSAHSSIISPPALKKADKVGVICPAGYMDPARMQDCTIALASWGLELVKGTTFHSESSNYFSGTDAERCQDLQQMLDNPAIKAIICGRGGYGISRMIDHLHFERFIQHPKWIVGFSDITLLHNHILNTCSIATIHGPMASAFIGYAEENAEGADGKQIHLNPATTIAQARNASILSLQNALFNTTYQYNVSGHPFNKYGQCTAPMIGGNLSLLVHALGTNSDDSWDNKILFIEDIGEYTYAVDRMMLQLLRSGKLDHLAGLVVGGFSDMRDTLRPFGQSVYEIILEKLNAFQYPVCFDFPISHDNANLAIKCGLVHHLNIHADQVTLACP